MTVGVLGGGQLAQMLTRAGAPLGIQCELYDCNPEACGGRVAPLTVAAFDDHAALAAFADRVDVVTYEFENVPVASVERIEQRKPVHPSSSALAAAQERLREKTLFSELRAPTPRYAPVDDPAALPAAIDAVGGLPVIVKTRRFGYDGKGQHRLRNPDDIQQLSADSAFAKHTWLVEELIEFQRELSIIAVRSVSGATVIYPLVENEHRGGILRRTRAPAPNVPAALQKQAEDIAAAVLDALHYVGALAIELFECDGRLLVNEMAPRVHNSGHWTIDAAMTSQFENHLRAILDLPLGPTAPRGASEMFNLIGDTPPLPDLLAIPQTRVHLYGKVPRAGRKVGHITLLDGPQFASAQARLLDCTAQQP